MTRSELRLLARQARDLKPLLHVGKAGLTDGVISQTRALLANHSLIKVRLPGDGREAVRAQAADLAARVPCELVNLTGCVAVYYLPPDVAEVNEDVTASRE